MEFRKNSIIHNSSQHVSIVNFKTYVNREVNVIRS